MNVCNFGVAKAICYCHTNLLLLLYTCTYQYKDEDWVQVHRKHNSAHHTSRHNRYNRHIPTLVLYFSPVTCLRIAKPEQPLSHPAPHSQVLALPAMWNCNLVQGNYIICQMQFCKQYFQFVYLISLVCTYGFVGFH